jgi:anti-sigma factor RsiW
MCDERERLIGYVYDECDPAERRAVEDHLEDCGTCRAEIGGLRSVRQDLLAWDVPPHDAVWRPLAPAPVLPWYRQVPAWAMAAAASVMFLVGAAGGVVTHALVPHERGAVMTAAAPVQMIPAGVTVGQLSEVEQRMVQMMRDELSKREVAARVVPAAIQPVPGPGVTPVRLNEILGASEQRQWEFVRDVQNDFFKQITSLKREMSGLKQEVVLMQQSGGGR